AVAFDESFTWTVNVLFPAAVGVPAMVAPLSERPSGSAPDVVHVLPPVPPLAASVCEYALPTVPLGSDEVVITSAAGSIAMESCFVAVAFDESFTWTVNVLFPAAVGVPAMVAPLSERPSGSAPDVVHVLPPVPPLSANVCEYALPTVPLGSEEV